MKAMLSAFSAGLLFALGLGLSGMAQPAVVLAFLDVTGHWNPALMAVMAGAIGVTLPAYQWLFRNRRPLFEQSFHLPPPERITLRLIAGSALFGVGWGLSGYCPGAGLLAGAGAVPTAMVFSVGMLAGFYLFKRQEAPALSKPPLGDLP